MAKLALTTLTGGYGSVDALNANFAAVAAQVELLLSRDGEAPNAMLDELDMNSQRIINLPSPVGNNDAATKAYADSTINTSAASASAAAASASAASTSASASAASSGAAANSATLSAGSAALAANYAQLSLISDYGDILTGAVNLYDYGAVV